MPCAASTAPSSARSRTSTGSARPRCSPSTAAPYGELRPAGRPRVHPDLRAAPRRDRGRRRRRSTCVRPGRDAGSGSARRRPVAGADAAPRHPPPNAAPAGDAAAELPDPAAASPTRGRGARGMTLEIDVLTLFPAMFEGPLAASIPGRIQEQGLADDPHPRPARVGHRPAPLGRRRAVRRGSGDDPAPGAGRGRARRAATRRIRPSILLDPVGEVFRQARAADLAARSHLIFVCPRYEGVDERIRSLVDLELSIGDYVLTGGELPALVVIDAVIRLLPGRDRGGLDGRGVLRRRPARIPAVHAAGGLPRHGRAGHPDLGRPWGRGALAPGAGDRADRGSAGRTWRPAD